jgi:hypothetical protein
LILAEIRTNERILEAEAALPDECNLGKIVQAMVISIWKIIYTHRVIQLGFGSVYLIK